MLSSMDDNFLDVLFSNANYDTPTSDNNEPPLYANPIPIGGAEILINHPIIDITLTQIL